MVVESLKQLSTEKIAKRLQSPQAAKGLTKIEDLDKDIEKEKKISKVHRDFLQKLREIINNNPEIFLSKSYPIGQLPKKEDILLEAPKNSDGKPGVWDDWQTKILWGIILVEVEDYSSVMQLIKNKTDEQIVAFALNNRVLDITKGAEYKEEQKQQKIEELENLFEMNAAKAKQISLQELFAKIREIAQQREEKNKSWYHLFDNSFIKIKIFDTNNQIVLESTNPWEFFLLSELLNKSANFVLKSTDEQLIQHVMNEMMMHDSQYEPFISYQEDARETAMNTRQTELEELFGVRLELSSEVQCIKNRQAFLYGHLSLS